MAGVATVAAVHITGRDLAKDTTILGQGTRAAESRLRTLIGSLPVNRIETRRVTPIGSPITHIVTRIETLETIVDTTKTDWITGTNSGDRNQEVQTSGDKSPEAMTTGVMTAEASIEII